MYQSPSISLPPHVEEDHVPSPRIHRPSHTPKPLPMTPEYPLIYPILLIYLFDDGKAVQDQHHHHREG